MVYSNIGRGRKLRWNVDLHPGSTPLFLMCDRTGQWWRKDENPEQQFHGEGLIWIVQKEGFRMQAGDIPFQKPLWFKILQLDSLWDNLLTKQNKCISHFLKIPPNTTPNTPKQEVLPCGWVLNMPRALPERFPLLFTRELPRSAKPSHETKLNKSSLLKPRQYGVHQERSPSNDWIAGFLLSRATDILSL